MTQDFQVIIKGGPGSGHFGHAGDPPNVGGSIPGSLVTSGRLNTNYFLSSTWRKKTSDMSKGDRQTVQRFLADSAIDSNHLNGITRITIEDGHGVDWDDVKHDDTLAFYNTEHRSIHINKEAGGMTKHTLVHELGHHVSQSMDLKQFGALQKVHDSILAEMFRKHNLKPGPWPVEAKKAINFLGYRTYSFSAPAEFIADTYAMTRALVRTEELERAGAGLIPGILRADRAVSIEALFYQLTDFTYEEAFTLSRRDWD